RTPWRAQSCSPATANGGRLEGDRSSPDLGDSPELPADPPRSGWSAPALRLTCSPTRCRPGSPCVEALRVGNECCAEVTEHAELGEDDCSFWVAVEALDLAVDQFEDVAARRVHA